MLGDGRLHLSAIARLAPHLTLENRDEVLRRAAHRSKRQIEELVAELSPRPDAPARIRRLPERHPPARSIPAPAPTLPMLLPTEGVLSAAQRRPEGVAGSDQLDSTHSPVVSRPQVAAEGRGGVLVPDRVASPTQPASIEPLSPARYKVQFTASATLREKLERLQALMRSSVPDGDLAAIVEAAVTEKLQRLEAKRFGSTRAPRKTLTESDTKATSSRHIPAAVKRAVRERDGYLGEMDFGARARAHGSTSRLTAVASPIRGTG